TLTYMPAANAFGSATVTVTATDDGGTANGGDNETVETFTIVVTAVNDAPAGTDTTVTTNEDIPYVFTVADFGFTDPDDVPADALLAVVIATLPAAGSLTLDGVPVTAGQAVAAAGISAGELAFTPAADASGTGYASFTFQ